MQASQRGRTTILLVEDDFATRRSLDALLTKEGFRVICAANCGEGVAVLDTYDLKADLIVLDIVDAARFRSIQRELPGASEIPVIGITVNEDDKAGLGLKRILRKPVDNAMLLDAIEQLV